MTNQIDIAKAIAAIAHRGQLDKSGNPYIGHPERVVGYLTNASEREIAAAWLHDVLEDTDITRDDLRAAGIDWQIIAVVETLTRTKDVSSELYYAGIAADYSARRVKRADIRDNTDPERLALLDDATIARLIRKYAKASLLIEGKPAL